MVLINKGFGGWAFESRLEAEQAGLKYRYNWRSRQAQPNTWNCKRCCSQLGRHKKDSVVFISKKLFKQSVVVLFGSLKQGSTLYRLLHLRVCVFVLSIT